MSRVVACAMTQAGTLKKINEDSFQVDGKIYPDTLNAREQKINQCDDYWQLYSITDGIGGAGVGDIASRVVQSFLVELRENFSELNPFFFDFTSYIQDFINRADKSLQERLSSAVGEHVGCSLALILFAGDTCYTMSIGSCRIYLYRGGSLFRMSSDHVLHDDFEARPLLFLGNHPGVYRLKAQNCKKMQVRSGDYFFLCTDGITAALQDDDIKWVLDKPSPVQSYVESLFQNARRYDSSDNQTILGLTVESRRAFSNPEIPDSPQAYVKNETIEFEDRTEEVPVSALTSEYERFHIIAHEAIGGTRPINTSQISRATNFEIYDTTGFSTRFDYDTRFSHNLRNNQDFEFEEEFEQEEFENKLFFSVIFEFVQRYPSITVSLVLLILLIISMFLIF